MSIETKPKAAKVKKEEMPRTGKMAMILDYSKKILKNEDWKVDLDPDSLKQSLPHIKTGSLIFDYVIGGVPNSMGVAPCPGLPRKRITQLWGNEGAGKTTLALTIAASTIAAGGIVVYIDWENAIVPDYALKLGVPVSDTSKFALMQPSTLEEGIKLIKIAAVGGADLIVVDSIGAGVPASQKERDIGEAGEQTRVGHAAKIWSEFLPELRSEIVKSGTAILGISQVRAKIGGMGNGPQSEPAGGYAWKFYSDLRMEIRRVQQEKFKHVNSLTNKTEERVLGYINKVKVIKCKLSDSQGREELFYLRQGAGIDDLRSLMEVGACYNVLRKSGAWFYYGEHKFQGMEQARRFFDSDQKEYDGLYRAVLPFLSQKTEGGPEADVDDDPGMDAQLQEMLTQVEDI